MTTEAVCLVEGRQPWYDDSGVVRQPLVIGVCGPSSSGKTALCKEIVRELKLQQWSMVIGMESFYKELTDDQRKSVDNYNWDHPDAFDWDLLRTTVRQLKTGHRTTIPVYDFKENRRSKTGEKVVYGVDLILIEGILAFHDKEVSDMMDIKLFCDIDDDMRLARRLRRDTEERGRSVEHVLRQYELFVKPCYINHIAPLKKKADIIVPRGSDNKVAINVIVKQVQKLLSDRGWTPVVRAMTPDQEACELPPNVHVLPNTPRIKAMMTFLRDRNTAQDDFIFYTDRLVSLLTENALSYLPYKPKSIVTPTGSTYAGEEFCAKPLAVSIMRGGALMEAPLRHICKGIRIGKILIESDENRVPSLIYVKLPRASLKDRHILLLDPVLATGATLIMAIHVLMDHGVEPKNIQFLTLTASFQGVQEVARRFPQVNIIAAYVQEGEISKKGVMLPGINTDRYFG